MELPYALREALELALRETPLSELSKATETLSQRYRGEVRDGLWHVGSDLAAKAYMAARMPATYAAVRASLGAIVQQQPEFEPRTLLDVGSGVGTVLWAVQDCWEGLEVATLLEGSEAMQRWGKTLLGPSVSSHITWHSHDVRQRLPQLQTHDLVTLSFVQGELEPATRPVLLEQLWNLTAHTLLIVEPGTPAGWLRMLEARRQLLELGASLVAPCPHAQSCPLASPEWCHFSQRVNRSRIHRQAKSGEVAWEDEKFVYLAVSRFPVVLPKSRIIAPVKMGSGHVRLRLCKPDGTEGEQVVSKREGEVFKRAKKLEWGDDL